MKPLEFLRTKALSRYNEGIGSFTPKALLRYAEGWFVTPKALANSSPGLSLRSNPGIK
jgi:hypothetical protein